MKKLILTLLLGLLLLSGYSQKIDSVSNPLEKILQNDFDSTILLSKYGGWDMSPNFYILSKKDSLVYFYRYSVNNKRYLGKRNSPLKSELGKKLFSSDYDINKIIPNINPYFKWFDTKLSRESIWVEFQKYNLWNFIDDDNIERKSRFTCGVLDGIYSEYRLITKNQVIKLKYFEPFEINKCEYNKFRDDISKIDKTILDFFK